MKTNQLFFAVFLSISFILSSFALKATPIPAGMLVAESLSSGNWSNPAIWSNGLVPQDSTFVTIRPGHTVTLTQNSACHALVIDSNATLDNGIYELRIQLRAFMHGIQWNAFDDGIPYGLSGNAPPIDATWDINNPNNVNWSIYMVNGSHAGSGDIKISFYDVYIGGASQPNSSPITITGNGTITNTGTLFIADNPGGNQTVIKFNSACNLSFYCDITIYSTSVSSGLKTDNYGNVHLKGNANLIMGGQQGVFRNKPNSTLTIDNGFLHVCELSKSVGYFLNEGIVDVLNGNINIPSFSMVDNRDTVNINGNILGLNSSSDQSNFSNLAVGAILSLTGEIFPSTNKGTLSTNQGANNPNYVIYNGTNQNVIVPHGPFATSTTEQAYSVVIFANSATKNLLGNISVNDSLIIQDNAIFNTSSNSYNVNMLKSSVWKNIGLDSDPFVENSGKVSFVGDNEQQHIINTLTNGETFYDLTINNSGSGVLLNSTDVNITDTLKLENGVVTTNTNKLSLTNPASGSLSLFSDTSFVNGNFRRAIASNTANYSFPIGYDTLATTYYRADLVNNNLVGVNYIDANVNTITESGNNVDAQLNTLEGTDPIIDVKNEAIWNLTPDAQPSSGDYSARLYTANVTGLTDNLFFTVKRPNLSVNYADWNTFSSTTTVPALGTSGRTLASGYAERGGLTSFSEFAIGTVTNLTTGIADKDVLANSINIYPNPATEMITIDLGDLLGENITIELIDVLGNHVSKGVLIGANKYQIKKGNLTKGMYLLKIITESNMYSKKVLFK